MIRRSRSPSMPLRPTLGFEKAVRKEFAFLKTEHQMQIVESQPTLVRYESDKFFVNVYHGRSSYELVFEVGRKTNPEEVQSPFRPGDFLRVRDPEAANALRYYVAVSRDEVERGVRLLATGFRVTAEEVLKRPELFEQLKRNRTKAIEAFAEDVHERQTRPKAEEAFRRGDYKAAAALYGSMEGRLTPTERRKLQIARERGN
jgi:hypothetical protein